MMMGTDTTLSNDPLSSCGGRNERRLSSSPPTEIRASSLIAALPSIPPLTELDFEEEESYAEQHQRRLYRYVTAAWRKLFHSNNAVDDGDSCVTELYRRQRPSLISSIKKYVSYCLFLVVFQVVVAICLKQCGYIENLDDMDNVMSQLEMGWHRLNESISMASHRLNDSISLTYLTQERSRPGFQMAEQIAAEQNNALRPVVMVPGFVTSGLEVWGGKECARKYFRQRLWGGLSSARPLLTGDAECWFEHLALDPHTGGDPENIRLRAAQGFEAADYFVANYWVWGKIIENLADVGYDGSTMTMEPYDWRLSFPMLEKRDGFLTKLQYKIEVMHKTTGKKVVLATHSMGAQLMHYFFTWVTTPTEKGGGGAGSTWVDDHIHAYVNIAGAHLGVPKAVSGLLSGESLDFVYPNRMQNALVEQFLPRKLRRDLWNTWGAMWSMLPQGGDAIWGSGADMCEGYSRDDPWCQEKDSVAPLLVMLDEPTNASVDTKKHGLEQIVQNFISRQLHYMDETIDFLRQWGGGLGSSVYSTSLFGSEPTHRNWHDLSKTPLPHAPNLNIYCLYGVGVETERGYYYLRSQGNSSLPLDEDATADPAVVMDTATENPARNIYRGVKFSDGDGSVPLLSLGYMCADGWRRQNSGLNPSQTKVVTREYRHRQEFSVDDPMRGGPHSANHVDILGNVEMLEDFLRIVTGYETQKVTDRIISNIESIVREVNEYGGVPATTPQQAPKKRFPLGAREKRRKDSKRNRLTQAIAGAKAWVNKKINKRRAQHGITDLDELVCKVPADIFSLQCHATE